MNSCCSGTTRRTTWENSSKSFLTTVIPDLGLRYRTEAVDQSQQHQGINLREIDPMSRARACIKQFLVSEDGPTAVEYAVMLALIIVVCLAAVSTVGSNANGKFNKVRTYLS